MIRETGSEANRFVLAVYENTIDLHSTRTGMVEKSGYDEDDGIVALNGGGGRSMVVWTEIVNFRQRVIPIPAQSTGENNIPSSKRLLVKFIVMTSFTHHLWATVFRARFFLLEILLRRSPRRRSPIRPVFSPRVLMPPCCTNFLPRSIQLWNPPHFFSSNV